MLSVSLIGALESMKLFGKEDRRVVVGSDQGQTGAADGGGVRGGSRTHRGQQLFLGEDQQSAICGATGRSIYYRALKKSGVRPKGGIHVLRKVSS